MISNKILVCELEQHYSYVPWPLRGPVNSTCVEVGGEGLHEAPSCDLHSGFVCLQRCAFLPKDKYFLNVLET